MNPNDATRKVLSTPEGQTLLTLTKAHELEAAHRGHLAGTVAEQDFLLNGPGAAAHWNAVTEIFGADLAEQDRQSSLRLLGAARQKQALDSEQDERENNQNGK